MSTDQILSFGILAAAMMLFLWGRWRHDLVAFSGLMLAALVGIVQPSQVFAGFGHPAVFTVAAVLVISRALQNSGVIDIVHRLLAPLSDRPTLQMMALTVLAAVLSAFMNNIGALALLMPVALEICARSGRPPSQILMPLSFASILGGLMTLIGTPPNIIIANFRADVPGTGFAPFEMFDFMPIGLALTVAGLAYIHFVGRRLLPHDRAGRSAIENRFAIENYITEFVVTDDSPLIGRTLRHLEELAEVDIEILAMIRDRIPTFQGLSWQRLKAGDIVVLQADTGVFKTLVQEGGLRLVANEEIKAEHLKSDDVGRLEVVVPRGSRIEGRTPKSLRLRTRHGINILAIARRGKPFKQRLSRVHLAAGDVLLLQGDVETMVETATALGCLPLAGRGLRVVTPRRVNRPLAIFAVALALTALRVVEVQVAFGMACVGMVLIRSVSLRELYESIDWSVIVLLGSMIPLGEALQRSGGTDLIASGILGAAQSVPPIVVIALLMIVTMTLSDFMNNAATAVVMAPIAVSMSEQLEVASDPFLMAVAISSSCAFLTPIGHQNNVLVMGPGGYRFGDYWRLGLPLEVLILLVSLPLLPVIWPL